MMGKLETLTVPTELGEWLEDREHEIGIGCELFTLIEDLRKSYYGNEFASAADSFIRKHKKELIEVIIGTREYEVEEPKVYARVKGWELMLEPYLTYFNKVVYGSNKLYLTSKHLTDRTKSEWNKLGINDSNADFVKVEEMEE